GIRMEPMDFPEERQSFAAEHPVIRHSDRYAAGLYIIDMIAAAAHAECDRGMKYLILDEVGDHPERVDGPSVKFPQAPTRNDLFLDDEILSVGSKHFSQSAPGAPID